MGASNTRLLLYSSDVVTRYAVTRGVIPAMCLDRLLCNRKIVPVEQRKLGHSRENRLGRYDVGVGALDRGLRGVSFDEGYCRFSTCNLYIMQLTTAVVVQEITSRIPERVAAKREAVENV